MAAARDNIVLVNITKEYSRELLLDFFNKLLKPNFGVRLPLGSDCSASF